MLYDKSKTEKLDNELFKNPTSEYRGAPFWAWNCKLEKDELVWQIEQLKKMGYGGFHMHVRAGMATEYLSDEYMSLISACVDKAKTEEMKAYLYDEDTWPSGFAGGIVTKEKKFRQKFLAIIENKIKSVDKDTALITGEPVFITAFDVILDGDGYIIEYKQIGEDDDAVGIKKYVYLNTRKDDPRYNNQAYVDTLYKDAIDKFIDVTHERFKSVVGSDFGQTVPSIFTDEPQFYIAGTLPFATSSQPVGLPWSFGFEEDFKAKYGYNIVDKLPELFWVKKGVKYSTARYHFHDFVCGRFTETFAKNIGTWCDKNNIALTGHVMREDTLWSQSLAVGEAMRTYKYFGIPGIDMLANEKNFNTAKQCQSIVHQYGKQGMLSELYGVTDWTFDFRGHKYQGDWQAALGVTLRVPHLSWVSMKGSAKRDYPASFNYHTPWYKEYPYVEDHFARVNTILTRGKPIVKVAVVHPIESYWLHLGPEEICGQMRTLMDERHEKLTDWLLGGLVDFDFISESDILEQKVEVGDKLTVGEMTYDTVIMPANQTLRKNTFNILKKFSDNGGKLIILEKTPDLIDTKPSPLGKTLAENAMVIPFTKLEVLNALEGDKILSIQNTDGKDTTNLLYAMREDGDVKWLFIAHKDVGFRAFNNYSWKDIIQVQDIKITLKGEYIPTLYDTVKGEIYPLQCSYLNGNTVIDYSIYESDSVMLSLKSGKSDFVSDKTDKEIIFEERLFRPTDYVRDEGNVVLLDSGEYKFDDGDWLGYDEVNRITITARKAFGYSGAQCQPWVSPKTPPKHKITMKYTFDCDYLVKGAKLNLEDADKSEIYLNGKKVLNEVVGYFADKAIGTINLPRLKKGTNVLVITIPYGERDFLEASYITGDFDVKLNGVNKTITKKTGKIGFNNLVEQGMPFYGGNVSYKINYNAPTDGNYEIIVNNYRGAMIRVFVDGQDKGVIAYSPYTVSFELTKGKHEIVLKLFGNRKNTFGCLHKTNKADTWYGPGRWLPEREEFCFEYLLSKFGILSAPIIRAVKCEVGKKQSSFIDVLDKGHIFG